MVVTDSSGTPVFANDFPYVYMYIAFSTPDLEEGETYSVYLGGEIEGTEQDGLYTLITAYTPGTLMQHGGGTAQQRMTMQQPEGGFGGQAPDMPRDGQAPEMPEGGFGGDAPAMTGGMDDVMNALNELDLNELLSGKDLNGLLTGFSIRDLLTDEQIQEIFGDTDISMLENMGRGFGGMGAPRGLESSSDVATTAFTLSRETTGFINVVAAE